MLRVALPAALSLLVLGACAPEEEVPLGPPTYVEDDDNGNGRRDDAEEVDVDWETEVVIQGTLEECGEWSGGGGGGGPPSFDGDLDYYEFELPADGWVEVVLRWEAEADLGMSIRRPGSNWPRTEDEEGTEGPEEWYPEDPLESGDDILVGVYCTLGDDGTAYTIEVELEED